MAPVARRQEGCCRRHLLRDGRQVAAVARPCVDTACGVQSTQGGQRNVVFRQQAAARESGGAGGGRRLQCRRCWGGVPVGAAGATGDGACHQGRRAGAPERREAGGRGRQLEVARRSREGFQVAAGHQQRDANQGLPRIGEMRRPRAQTPVLRLSPAPSRLSGKCRPSQALLLNNPVLRPNLSVGLRPQSAPHLAPPLRPSALPPSPPTDSSAQLTVPGPLLPSLITSGPSRAWPRRKRRRRCPPSGRSRPRPCRPPPPRPLKPRANDSCRASSSAAWARRAGRQTARSRSRRRRPPPRRSCGPALACCASRWAAAAWGRTSVTMEMLARWAAALHDCAARRVLERPLGRRDTHMVCPPAPPAHRPPSLLTRRLQAGTGETPRCLGGGLTPRDSTGSKELNLSRLVLPSPEAHAASLAVSRPRLLPACAAVRQACMHHSTPSPLRAPRPPLVHTRSGAAAARSGASRCATPHTTHHPWCRHGRGRPLAPPASRRREVRWRAFCADSWRV